MTPREMRFAYPVARREQLILYSVSVDEAVPKGDPVRALAALLDEVDWRPWEDAYVGCGQPPIHPRYLAGAILLGLLNKVRTLRELERACRKHLDFMWLLEGFRPDHSTFAAFQKRHVGSIRELNLSITRTLVSKREDALLQLIIDGTRLRANSERQGARTAEFIEACLEELNRRLERLQQEQETPASETDFFAEMAPGQEKQTPFSQGDKPLARCQAQRDKYQKALGIARERDARSKAHNGEKAAPVRVPVTDPESQITPNKEGGYAPNYTPVAAVEPQTGAIVFTDVLPGSDEAAAVLPAVAAAAALLEQTPEVVLADSNFASGEVLEALDSAAIDAYMPTRSISPPNNPALRSDPAQPVAQSDRERLPRQGDKLARTAFVYDCAADVYYCPMGHALTAYKHGKDRRGSACTYYQCRCCSQCPLAPDCTKAKAPYRTITRDQYEPLREKAASRMATDAGKAIYRGRAPGIETVFAILKAAFGIRYFRLRGLANVQMEWTWICTAYNIKKLLNRSMGMMKKAPQYSPQSRIGALTSVFRRASAFVGITKKNQWSCAPWRYQCVA